MKIMNPTKKSEYEVLSMRSKAVYNRVADLKDQVLQEFRDKVQDPVETIGYIEPGHGLRGKQRWLSSTDDLRAMYQCIIIRNMVFRNFCPCQYEAVFI